MPHRHPFKWSIIVLLITIIFWYFSSPAKIIIMDSQIENNKILNQQILNESGEKLILKEILNNDINVVLLLRHFG